MTVTNLRKNINLEIKVTKEVATRLESLMDMDTIDLSKDNIPQLSNLFSKAEKFSFGDKEFILEVKVNSSEDDVWSEMVLFKVNGQFANEIFATDVSDGLLGIWDVDSDSLDFKLSVNVLAV